jgi:hypothetical protein
MALTKVIAILFFVASVVLGGIVLKDAYDAYAERTNSDASRASHVITPSGSYEYIYSVEAKTVARLKADAWSYSLYCVVAAAVGAVLWRLAGIGDRLRRNADRGSSA